MFGDAGHCSPGHGAAGLPATSGPPKPISQVSFLAISRVPTILPQKSARCLLLLVAWMKKTSKSKPLRAVQKGHVNQNQEDRTSPFQGKDVGRCLLATPCA